MKTSTQTPAVKFECRLICANEPHSGEFLCVPCETCRFLTDGKSRVVMDEHTLTFAISGTCRTCSERGHLIGKYIAQRGRGEPKVTRLLPAIRHVVRGYRLAGASDPIAATEGAIVAALDRPKTVMCAQFGRGLALDASEFIVLAIDLIGVPRHKPDPSTGEPGFHGQALAECRAALAQVRAEEEQRKADDRAAEAEAERKAAMDVIFA